MAVVAGVFNSATWAPRSRGRGGARHRSHLSSAEHGNRAPRGALWLCGGERTSPLGRRSGLIEAEGSLVRETPGRAGSSPDKAGTYRYCQMVRVRQARREGAREKSVLKHP